MKQDLAFGIAVLILILIPFLFSAIMHIRDFILKLIK